MEPDQLAGEAFALLLRLLGWKVAAERRGDQVAAWRLAALARQATARWRRRAGLKQGGQG